MFGKFISFNLRKLFSTALVLLHVDTGSIVESLVALLRR